jgi:hypothetical protein
MLLLVPKFAFHRSKSVRFSYVRVFHLPLAGDLSLQLGYCLAALDLPPLYVVPGVRTELVKPSSLFLRLIVVFCLLISYLENPNL